jgi:predicted permease
MIASLLAAEDAEKASSLPISPIAFGVLAMVFFLFLLLVTFAFRSVAHRH